MNINPGDLRHKIDIITKVETKDSDGFATYTDSVIWSGYARVTNTSGTELIRSGASFADAKKRFLIRYTKTAITTNMVIKHDGKQYNILYINDYEDKHEYLEIYTDMKEL